MFLVIGWFITLKSLSMIHCMFYVI